MSPRLFRGAKMAERGPMTILQEPWAARLHTSVRSEGVILECTVMTSSAKCARNRRTVWGVREISGTRTIAERPDARHRLIASMYTWVLPLPVIPCSRNVCG